MLIIVVNFNVSLHVNQFAKCCEGQCTSPVATCCCNVRLSCERNLHVYIFGNPSYHLRIVFERTLLLKCVTKIQHEVGGNVLFDAF